MGTRVALYLRQSLDSEGTGLAVARQERQCRDYVARREGWQVVAVYRENSVSASGRKVRRKFAQMITDGKAGEFDVIVAQHLDRLTRSIKDYLPLLELAEKHGIGTTTVSGELDLTTDMGQTLAGVLAVFANGEIKRKGRRQMAANDQRAEAGTPSQGGRRAFGYQADGMRLHRAEARHVRAAYTALLAGDSLTSIADGLNRAEVTTVSGRAWTHNAIRQVLLNPRNAGIRVHRGVEVGKAAWKPIVDESTFRAAVAILADPGRRTNKGTGERRRLLTGVALCGVCSDGKTTVLGGSRRAGEPLYRCSRSKHLMRALDPIDHYVQTVLLERLRRPDAAELLVDTDAPDLAALTAERVELVGVQEQAAIDFTDRVITRAQLLVITERATARIAQIDKAMSRSDRERVLGELIRAADPYPVWEAMSLPRKQAVLRELGTWIIHRGKVGGSPTAKRYKSPEDYRVEFLPAR